MTFDLYTKKLFFNAPIENFNKSLLIFLNKERRLNKVVYEGDTIYPPLSALEQEKSERHIFKFESHPEIAFKFREGEIELTSYKDNRKKIYVPVLKLIFDKNVEAKRGHEVLIKEFEKRRVKRGIKDSGFKGEKYQINLYCGKGDVLVNGYVLLVLISKYLKEE
jgi:hypothetical protein